MTVRRNGSALIVVENLPVPFDRRVWQQSLALKEAGWDVTVICPGASHGQPSTDEEIEGVQIRRFAVDPAGSALGYAREYGQAFFRIWHLARRFRGVHLPDVVQVCNPPDFLFLAVEGLRRRGSRLVFDQHDLVPELFRTRWGHLPLGAVIRSAERLSYRRADVVMVTNRSFRDVAVSRGGVDPSNVFVVRNAPDPRRFINATPDLAIKRGKPHLIAYLGLMGDQDGVDTAIRALALVRERRSDWHAIFMGDGDAYESVRALSQSLGLVDCIEFTGRADDALIGRVLKTADVGLSPEMPSPLNDVSTLTKVVEYMACGCPVVAFRLKETFVSAGDAAIYADRPDAEAYADAVCVALANPDLRATMGAVGRARFEEELSWERARVSLLGAYELALSGKSAAPRAPQLPHLRRSGRKTDVR